MQYNATNIKIAAAASALAGAAIGAGLGFTFGFVLGGPITGGVFAGVGAVAGALSSIGGFYSYLTYQDEPCLVGFHFNHFTSYIAGGFGLGGNGCLVYAAMGGLTQVANAATFGSFILAGAAICGLSSSAGSLIAAVFTFFSDRKSVKPASDLSEEASDSEEKQRSFTRFATG